MIIAQYIQVSIRQFLNAGDPYYIFLTENFGVLNISRFTMGPYNWQVDYWRIYEYAAAKHNIN